MEKVNSIRVEARLNKTNVLITSSFVEGNKELIAFINYCRNRYKICDKYVNFIVRHMTKRQFIEETKKTINKRMKLIKENEYGNNNK